MQAEIQSGAWAVGDRLPSERALTRQFNASRVVIREALAALRSQALAALRSQGMVVSRRGAGTYVAAQRPSSDGLVIKASERSDILNILESRRAVEVEAAGLAARRASPYQLEKIAQHLADMRKALAEQRRATQEDWRFHLGISEATNNPYFPKIMAAFGAEAVPRIRIAENCDPVTTAERERSLLTEHEAILGALEAGDPISAQEAMRRHLSHALARYRTSGDPREGRAPGTEAPPDIGPPETGPPETGPPETGPPETGPQETGPQEIAPSETRSPKIGMTRLTST